MKRTRTSSTRLGLSRETVRRLVDSDLGRVHAGAGVGLQALTDLCFTDICPPPKRDPVP